LALLTYIQGRNTKDVNLLMSVENVRRISELRVEDENEFFARGRFRSLQVDFLLTANPLFQTVALRFAACHPFAEIQVPTATVEGIVLLKLYALPSLYRQFDWARIYIYEGDIKTLLALYDPDVQPLLDLLAPHLQPGDLGELKKLIAEARQSQARARHADA